MLRRRPDGAGAAARVAVVESAQGHTNTAIGDALGLSERTVETHMRAIFNKLGLLDDGTTHRRVRAVITYLESVGGPEP